MCLHIKTFCSVWRRCWGIVKTRSCILHLRKNLVHNHMQYQRVRRNHLPMHKGTPCFARSGQKIEALTVFLANSFGKIQSLWAGATERISEARGQKRKMRLLESEANRKFLESRNWLRKNTVGSLYETPRLWSIGWYKAPWSLRRWDKLPPAPFLAALDFVSTV